MAGLVPAIHVFIAYKQDVDARNKCGHNASVQFSGGLVTANSFAAILTTP